MNAGVTVTRHNIVHLVFDMQFEFLEALLLNLIRAGNMRLGFYLLYLVFQMRMLLG